MLDVVDLGAKTRLQCAGEERAVPQIEAGLIANHGVGQAQLAEGRIGAFCDVFCHILSASEHLGLQHELYKNTVTTSCRCIISSLDSAIQPCSLNLMKGNADERTRTG